MPNSLSMLDFINRLPTLDEKLNVCFYKYRFHWNPDDKCILANDEEIEKIFSSNIFYYCLGVYVVKDVIENLSQQNPEYTPQQAFNAINFYLQNDAFMELSENK